jgi:glutamyl-tRNA synthetase
MNVIGLKETDLPEIMVHDFRKNGYLPEAMNNFLALLGWNPGENREHMTMDEMAKLFVLSDIGRSNAKFNREKLVSFNKDHSQRLLNENPTRLVEAMREYLATHPESPVNAADDATLLKLLQMKAGFRLLREVDEQARFLFVADDEIKLDPAAVEKVLKKNDGFAILKGLRNALEPIGDWTAANVEAAINQFATERNLKLNQVAQPLRVAITGTTVSPPIFQSLDMLGKASTIDRIDRSVASG